MGKNDANNLFNLAIGAVAGIIIYTIYNNHVRSYAANVEPINCDGPRPWNPKERRRFAAMSITERSNYLKIREIEFRRLCASAAREIRTSSLDDEIYGTSQNLSNKHYAVKSGGDPLHPQRKPGMHGLGLEYPTYDPDTGRPMFGTEVSPTPGNQAAFVYAFAAKKKKKASGGKSAKGGAGAKADKGAKDAGAAPDAGADAPQTDTPVSGDACDCTCMPMASDKTKFKIETAAGVDCYNHVYPPSMAECETALKEVCAKRGGATTPDATAPGTKDAPADKPAKGASKSKSKSAAYARAYATYMQAYAAKKKAAAKPAKGGAKDAAAPDAAPADAAPAKGGAAPAGAAPASGGGNCGKLVYTGTGKTASGKGTGAKTRHYASGKPDDTTQEWNIANSPFTNYEYTAYVNVGKPDHNDQVSFKMWGPTHQDGKGAWYLMDVGFTAGDFSLGHEKPHPKTTMGEVKGKSAGSIASKTVGLKSVVYQTGGGAHIEGWMDQGGTWVKMVEGDNVGGKFTRDPAQNIQLRIDAAPQVKVSCAVASEITPPGGGGGGAAKGAAPAAPAGKAATPAKGAATPAAKPAKAAKGAVGYAYRVTIA